MFDFDKWIEINCDGETECSYCNYREINYDDCYYRCPRNVVCYGGEPIFPKCADFDIRELLDEDAIIKDLIDNDEYEDYEIKDKFPIFICYLLKNDSDNIIGVNTNE